LGDFHVPAVHRTQGVVVSVGTEGQAPARASAIRDAIARWLSS
jgi:siroheme synthase (precorrin-2 oxidase/ferrochelatase)